MKIQDIPEPWYEKQVWHNDLTPKWHLMYYDGPLTGIVQDDETGELYYVACPHDLDRAVWCVWRLTPEELSFLQTQHEVFRTYVGHHTDYDPETYKRTLGLNHQDRETMKKFYDDPQWKRDLKIEDRDFDFVCRNPFW